MRERKYRSQFFNVFPWSNVPGLGYMCESTFLFFDKCFRWQARVLCALLSAAIAHNGVGSGSRGYLFTVVFSLYPLLPAFSSPVRENHLRKAEVCHSLNGVNQKGLCARGTFQRADTYRQGK